MHEMQRLIAVMAALRDPRDGCPWDLEQSFETIAPYTIEEAYEVADAIARGDHEELLDELGDLLFQVVFHARMAEEADLFRFEDVARAIVEKMIRRHPHVFDGEVVASADEQSRAWEAHKAAERRARGAVASSSLDGVSAGMPALARALELQRRAATVGFDWRDPGGVLDKLEEEIAELRAALDGAGEAGSDCAEVGDLLFTCVNLARHLDVDPELVLRGASHRFEARFRCMERDAGAQGLALEDCDPEHLEMHWARAKQALAKDTGRG